ncbi:ABC transporter permease [Candidatus Chloroploca asiatica]|uniref:Tungstate transporter permease n=1 Tax=Candidatus Chloroploca asiatica TaxID=1506545 RepID=A0A2H3KT10_9CHLR|nr:ABC transporter permease [Candidatus Chloroploca asiatica]PDV97002.1 tungstate transporter permease [Candidatus Chloroploca asiatica]
MNYWQEAINLLVGGNSDVWAIIILSLQVSGVALLISAIIGVPLGSLIGLHTFPGRQLVIAIVYTGMGFPPVVIGLAVFLLLSRSGPLGFLGWLFTPSAMVLAQVILALPLVIGFTMSAVLAVDPALRTQIRALGASPTQTTLAMLWEARVGVLVALIAGFGGIISEVGAVMLVGGNIQGSTRVLTTAIVLETRKGAFDVAIALALVLLGITFVINLALLQLQGTLLKAKQ